MTNFIRYPITLYIGNHHRKIIPYSICNFSKSWILRGLCDEKKVKETVQIDNISGWDLKHSTFPEGGGVRIDHNYRLLIRKENDSDTYLTSIYHFNDLKYHLKETFEIYDQIIFTQNISLKIPSHDYFL